MNFLVRAAAAVVSVSSIAAAQAGTTATFVITNGMDTVAVERFTRSATALTGDLRLVQLPASLHVHYASTLRPDGSSSRVDVIDDAPNFFTGVVVFDASSMLAARSELGALNDRIRMSPPGSYPVVGPSMALMEQVARAVHPAVGDSVTVGAHNIRNGNVSRLTVTRTAPDSVVLACDGCMRMGVRMEIRAALNKNGDIIGGTNPGMGWLITRR